MSNNEEVLLPTRDFLRQLIGQTKVKTTELKSVLRARGVFTGSEQKEVTGPILIKTGLSPFEYIDLRESYRTKEESPKSKTRTITWDSETNLIESIPHTIDYETLLNDQFGVFSISSLSDFTVLDDNPNHVYMDFEIDRRDPVKNWGENSATHSGRVEIRKSDDGKTLSISLSHTAPETMEFGNKVSNSLIKHFKSEGHIKHDSDIRIIRYSDFTNENRVLFLNDLTQNAKYSMLTFTDTRDIHFSPDHNVPNPPTNIAWMKDKIEDMKMKGQGLHSTFFVSDTSIHPFVKLFGVQCDYRFENEICSGTCRILFEFSGKEDPSSGELTLNLSMPKMETNEEGLSRAAINKRIMESLERYKMEAYEKHRIKQP
ncbi:hypothetical protein J7J49_16550 [Halomonas sp. ISL-56]|uniref:GapS4b family protein n=1 Tax=Halomonas sp. ISL-56 TaxID=2819149 RepID=UPI001BEADFD1|nr:hypothetical protein [Halomonas sp. ISL-56]MBT2802938.1 hypothetical protein [Halomonas sp. ISL-56]